jgi:phage FluMu protein Com
MIQLQLTHAVVLYAGIIGILAIAIWIYTEFSVTRTRTKLTKQHLWRCTYCGYTYLDDSGVSVTRCPRCENLNGAQEAQDALVITKSATEQNAHDQIDTRKNPSRGKQKRGKKRGPRRKSR